MTETGYYFFASVLNTQTHTHIHIFNTKSYVSKDTLIKPLHDQVEPIIEKKVLSPFYLLIVWSEVQEKTIAVPTLKFLQGWLINESFDVGDYGSCLSGAKLSWVTLGPFTVIYCPPLYICWHIYLSLWPWGTSSSNVLTDHWFPPIQRLNMSPDSIWDLFRIVNHSVTWSE